MATTAMTEPLDRNYSVGSHSSGVFYPPSTPMGVDQRERQKERRKDGKRRRNNLPPGRKKEKAANNNNINDKPPPRRSARETTPRSRTPSVMPSVMEDSVASPVLRSPNKYSPPPSTKRREREVDPLAGSVLSMNPKAADPHFLDTLVSRVDQEGTDKYRTMISEQVEDLEYVISSSDMEGPDMDTPLSKTLDAISTNYDAPSTNFDAPSTNLDTTSNFDTTTSTNFDTDSVSFTEMEAYDDEFDGATHTTGYTSASAATDGVTDASSVGSQQKYTARSVRGLRSPPISTRRRTTSDKADRLLTAEEVHLWAEASDYYNVQQKFAYLSILIGSIQLLILVLQLLLCGVAPMDVNPMVGPFPDAFSEWGGKNTYLMRDENEWWRLITPGFLHVGILHLAVNAWILLDTCGFFEREWGSLKWFIVWALSEVGCILTASVADPDDIAVGSSGAIMGLFGAKLSQVLGHTIFDMADDAEFHLEQLSGILCSLSLVLCLSFFTYIDWSGNMGGLGTGFCLGMILLAGRMQNVCLKWIWRLIGLGLLGAGWYFSITFLLFETETDPDLADPCEYFRNLFVEDHNCNCLFG